MSCIDGLEVQLRSSCCRRGRLLPGASHVFAWSKHENATWVLYVRNMSLGNVTIELQWYDAQPTGVGYSESRGYRICQHESVLLHFDQINQLPFLLSNLGRQSGQYELVLMAYQEEQGSPGVATPGLGLRSIN